MRYCGYHYLRMRKAYKHSRFVALYNEFMANDEYAKIVNNAKQRGLKRPPRYILKDGVYVENRHEIHHIVPKCCGGYNYKYNLVLLTRQEHIKCHEILASMGYAEYAFLKMSGKYEDVCFYRNIRQILLFHNKCLNKPSEKLYFINAVEKAIIEFFKEKPQCDNNGALKELMSHDSQKRILDAASYKSKIDSLDIYTEPGLQIYNTLDSIMLDDLLLLNDVLLNLKIATNDLYEKVETLIVNIRKQIEERIKTILNDIYALTSKIDINDVRLAYLEYRLGELQEYKPIVETLGVIHNSTSSSNHLIVQCKKCLEAYNTGIIKYNEYIGQKLIQIEKQRELLKVKIISYLPVFLCMLVIILLWCILMR